MTITNYQGVVRSISPYSLAGLAIRRTSHNLTQQRARSTASFLVRSSRRRSAIRTPSVLLRARRVPSSLFSSKCSKFSLRPVDRQSLQASMYFRGIGVALTSALAYGAWSMYKTDGTDPFGVGKPYPSAKSRPTTASPDESPKQGRQVLVVSANELHTGTWVGDGPISKQIDGDGRRVIEMLTADQATDKLRKHEQSFFVNRDQGVVRYDVVQLSSNDPIEDDHSERIVVMPNKTLQEGEEGTTDWMFWGVFDGHRGWTTSAKLRQSLIRYVAQQLNSTYKETIAENLGIKPSPEAIDAAVKKGFTRLDNEIVHEAVEHSLKAKSKNKAAELLAPALSGSCAILSFYDPASESLRVACTGDSRAVLGRKSDTGKWKATPLSRDQTVSNEDEAERMRKEHPGEESKVVRNGRILGRLGPTRAFGDAIYKWSRDVHEKLCQSFFVRSVSPDILTPPYVTAEPVVTTTKVEPQNGDFVVMATDGLWEMLTNEEVVGLVGKWIEAQHPARAGLIQQDSQNEGLWKKLWSSGRTGLPVESSTDDDQNNAGQRAPMRQQQWGIQRAEERLVVKDKNVATHLVRNALGGKNEEQVCALLTLPSPYSRRFRDDLTVTVIFFGNQQGPKSGIEVNEEATAPVQPKL